MDWNTTSKWERCCQRTEKSIQNELETLFFNLPCVKSSVGKKSFGMICFRKKKKLQKILQCNNKDNVSNAGTGTIVEKKSDNTTRDGSSSSAVHTAARLPVVHIFKFCD